MVKHKLKQESLLKAVLAIWDSHLKVCTNNLWHPPHPTTTVLCVRLSEQRKSEYTTSFEMQHPATPLSIKGHQVLSVQPFIYSLGNECMLAE